MNDLTAIEIIVCVVFVLFVMRGVLAFVKDDLKIGRGKDND